MALIVLKISARVTPHLAFDITGFFLYSDRVKAENIQRVNSVLRAVARNSFNG